MMTIGELVHSHAKNNSDQPAFVYLDGEMREETMTYGDLDESSLQIASLLLEESEKKHPALIVYPHGLNFVRAFFGCIYAGKIAVPLRPPSARRNLDSFRRVLLDSGADIILSPDALHHRLERSINDEMDVPWISPDSTYNQTALEEPSRPKKDDLAFLQYTSGSTGNPKGVMVDHGALITNLDFSQRVFGHDGGTVGGSWLPMFHDMGLIGIVLGSLHCGATSYLISPEEFIRNPILWLKLITKYRVETTATPTFGFEHCLNSIDAGAASGLDLSSLSTAIVGAEPVRYDTLRRFYEAYAEFGLKPDIFFPSYGMAEATLYLSSARFDVRNPNHPYCFHKGSIDRGVVELLEPAGDGAADRDDSYFCVPHGNPSPDVEVKIVDPEDKTLVPDRTVGEIWVRAAHVTSGYWRNGKDSGETFGARVAGISGESTFLRTGDLGFVYDDSLYISGRRKDLIIIRGRNHFPQDLETTVEAVDPDIQPFGVAAFADGEPADRVVIVAEVKRERARKGGIDLLESAIRERISEIHGLVARVEFTRPYALPKTTSGKIRRVETKRMLDSNEFVLITPAPAKSIPASTIADGKESSNKTNELATWIAEWAVDRFELRGLDIDRSIASAGLDSISGIELAALLSKQIGTEVDPTFLWTEPSVRSLAARLVSGEVEPTDDGLFIRESHLADTIGFHSSRRDRSSPSRDNKIFLTGATGFLGAFILRDLIDRTDAEVVALVRSANESEGFERLAESARRYSLPESMPPERVTVFPGDLASEHFGSPSMYTKFSETTGTIIHSAALVDFTLSYPAFRNSTVLGTRRLLEFAAAGRQKRFHHISSVAVFESKELHTTRVDEKTSPIPSEGIVMGYSRAKWTTEQLVGAASKNGLDTVIYRPSLISGHSRTGAWSESDFLIRLFLGCLELGLIADIDYDLDATPVDYVSRAIAASATDRSSSADIPKVIHLNNPNPMPWEALGQLLANRGFDLEQVDLTTWRSRFLERATGANNSLFPFRGFFVERSDDTIPELYRRSVRPVIESQLSLQYLSRIGLPAPESFRQLLESVYLPLFEKRVMKS